MAGYDGYSMSNNARAAYEAGERPMTKWTKRAIIEAVAMETDELERGLLEKLRKEELIDLFLEWRGWHHTSKMYNRTNFYGVNVDEEITNDYLENVVLNRVKNVKIKEQVEKEESKPKIGIKMKTHYEYARECIGVSDIASLIIRGGAIAEERKISTYGVLEVLSVCNLTMGGDSMYHAYIVDEKCEIPEYYKLVKIFEHWIQIYDDEMLVKEFSADKIRVYRAGRYGTIIQLIVRDSKDII